MQTKRSLFVACLICILVNLPSAKGSQNGSLSAVAILKPTQGNQVKGSVTFKENNGKTRVIANVSGLNPGKHGFHVHETGDCSAPDGMSAGGHFNPENHKHGGPDASEHHAGDLGNVVADSKGRAHLDRTVTFLTVSDGPDSVAGKALILHAQEDDLQPQATGNAGKRVACGVVKRKT